MSQQQSTVNDEMIGMLKMIPNTLTNVSNTLPDTKATFKHFVKRADTEKLKAVFLKYASVEKNGIHYMTAKDFICRYLGVMPPLPTPPPIPVPAAHTTTTSPTTATAAATTTTTTTSPATAAATTTTTSPAIAVATTATTATSTATSPATAATTTTTAGGGGGGGVEVKSGYCGEAYDEDTIMLLANVVDTTNDGLISFTEFQAFEGCLVQPDSIYALAFSIFDKNSNGYISYDEFFDVLCRTELHKRIPFDFDSPFILLHFGHNKQKLVSYCEFTKILHDFYEEHALQAFMRYDEKQEGFITATQFNDIMLSLKNHLLTEHARDNLLQVVSGGSKRLHTKHISYSYFTAFISLLNNMELIKQIYISAAKNNPEAGLTREEILHEAQKYTQITPLEVDILFQLVSIKNQTGKIFFQDIRRLAPLDSELLPIHFQDQAIADALAQGRGIFIQILESLYRFTLGSIAGATGATAVYPIDLVKTRLQNQRTASYIGERMYKNSFDCFKKVVRHEGFWGLYRGLLPQIVGVAPEKAIKLTVNDFVRDKTTSPDGKIPIWGEILAGCSAGGCQVIFTNPLEIVKIRLQVAGEIATSRKLGAVEIVKDLGYLGLYKGAPACLLRDIPFSGIFFPLYAHIKGWSANKDGYNSIPSLLISATIAGAPAAALCTPADVIKTRLQVVARKGQTTYDGIIDCARKVFKEEGFKAFWKGAPARVFRSSPQFGVTLATYEILQRFLNFDFGGRQLAGSTRSRVHRPRHPLVPKNPDHIGGYRLALAAFDGMETKFGLCFPKFKKVYQ